MARKIHVKGIVQGVGFRPFVYLLAEELGISGWVLNAVDGVHIHAEAPSAALERFMQEVELQAPAAAAISSISWEEVEDEGIAGFSITSSDVSSAEPTFVSPDLATCSACVSELFDKENRRFHYPFINCTNCGPRFTIIERLPYDRAATTMSDFVFCPQCAGEYVEVSNRRFHAQPNACFACGPLLELTVPETGEHLQGTTLTQSDALLKRAAELLSQGKILAVKGLGGYHLACDATNEEAVLRLRERKQRPRKPLAVMFADIAALKLRFAVCEAEAEVLTSAAAPIVLLLHSAPANVAENPAFSVLAPAVTCGLAETGVMLPSTPLQHLLLRAVSVPLVMTSGNMSEEPIIADDKLAGELLGTVADAFISNNRQIVSRYDDSVVRVLSETVVYTEGAMSGSRAENARSSTDSTLQFVRRARGYAPRPLDLPFAAPVGQEVLAVGPEQKNTFCLTHNNKAFVSQHLGNLEQANSLSNQLHTITLYEQLFDIKPAVLACDLHPEYLSTKWAEEQAASRHIPLISVQHHHAHIAAVLAENSHEGRVIGLALDGTGYGLDGTIWGGEVLVASLSSFERVGRLEPFALPGGAQAIKHPLRAAYALLLHHELTEHPAAARARERLGDQALGIITSLVQRGINSPLTSSAGRLFDAVSALLGVCEEATYEGEPAILLEAAMQGAPVMQLIGEQMQATGKQMQALGEQTQVAGEQMQAFGEQTQATGKQTQTLGEQTPRHESEGTSPQSQLCTATTGEKMSCRDIPTRSLILSLLDLLQADVSVATVARVFHDGLMALFVDAVLYTRDETGITTVALSGGCFNNRYLATQLPRLLKNQGFEVLMHIQLPPNDGCVSYGQAAIACSHLNKNAPTSSSTGGATLTPCV